MVKPEKVRLYMGTHMLHTTDSDIHQVLQRLLDEKQRVKKLEQELSSLKCEAPLTTKIDSLPSQTQSNSDSPENHVTHEKQIQILKKIIDELLQKIEELQKRPEALAKDTSEPQTHTKLRQELYTAQTELREAKERVSYLEEETNRLRTFRHTMLQEKRELGAKASEKTNESEQIKKELTLTQQRCTAAENMLEALKKESTSWKTAEEELKNEKIQDELLIQGLRREIETLKQSILHKEEQLTTKKQDDTQSTDKRVEILEATLEDQKLIVHELHTHNKALEKKIALLTQSHKNISSSQESAFELTILQLKQENDLRIQELLIAKQTIENLDGLVKKEREQSQQHELNGHELKKLLLLAESDLEVLRKEKAHEEHELKSIRQEHELKEQELQENKERISLLEHHLARRVKECALLSKTQDEQAIAIVELNNKITQQELLVQNLNESIQEKEKALEQQKLTYTHDLRLREERLQQLEQERHKLMLDSREKSQEIARLAPLEEKFHQVSQLLQHFEAPVKPAYTSSAPQAKAAPIQETLFQATTRAHTPIKHDLFE